MTLSDVLRNASANLIHEALHRLLGEEQRAPEPHAAEEAEPAPGTGAPRKRYRLGLLFVHGMGAQERGDTVTQMGDALTEWLRRWIENAPKGSNADFKIRGARLRGAESSELASADPRTAGQAHLSVRLTRPEDEDDPGETWLLAESWWAGSFRPASFSELVTWASSVGPWLIASQAAGLAHRLRPPAGAHRQHWIRRVFNRVAAWVLILAAAIVAAVVTPVAIALLVFSLIPIPFVSELARGLARNLAGSFGDLLVLVRSPVRFAAMAERVRQDIADLDKECDRVMVVAHSQGSAVAWHAIRRNAERPAARRADVPLFLSFGQAFRKLHSLHRLHTQVPALDQFLFALLATESTVLLLLSLPPAIDLAVTLIQYQGNFSAAFDEIARPSFLLVLSLAAVLVIQYALGGKAEDNDACAEAEIRKDIEVLRAALPGFQWLDIWASADPAPNGPLLRGTVAGVDSYRIRNRASTALDHSVYWSNVTEFVSAVAFAAAALVAGSVIGQSAVPPALTRAVEVRNYRVWMLATGRLATFVALFAALVGLLPHLPAIGQVVLDFVDSLPLIPDWFDAWPALAIGTVGAALGALLATVLWWLLSWAWKGVIRSDEKAFFERHAVAPEYGQRIWTVPSVLWIAAAFGIPPTAVIVLSVLLGQPWPGVIHGVLFALGVVILLYLLDAPYERRLGEAPPPPGKAPPCPEPGVAVPAEAAGPAAPVAAQPAEQA